MRSLTQTRATNPMLCYVNRSHHIWWFWMILGDFGFILEAFWLHFGAQMDFGMTLCRVGEKIGALNAVLSRFWGFWGHFGGSFWHQKASKKRPKIGTIFLGVLGSIFVTFWSPKMSNFRVKIGTFLEKAVKWANMWCLTPLPQNSHIFMGPGRQNNGKIHLQGPFGTGRILRLIFGSIFVEFWCPFGLHFGTKNLPKSTPENCQFLVCF